MRLSAIARGLMALIAVAALIAPQWSGAEKASKGLPAFGDGISYAPQRISLSTSPDGKKVAYIDATNDKTRLTLLDPNSGQRTVLASKFDRPLQPAWDSKGWIWFVQQGQNKQFELKRVRFTGGQAEDFAVKAWQPITRFAKLVVRTWQGISLKPARLSVVDERGHPVIPASTEVRFDDTNRRAYFYSPGKIELEVPAGKLSILASHGFDGAKSARITVRAGATAYLDIRIPSTGYTASHPDWFSADLHNHLNFNGWLNLEPPDLLLPMVAEDLNFATPMIANSRMEPTDVRWARWSRTVRPYLLFSQEVRSHFSGHVGVLGADRLYQPSFFGPGYPGYDGSGFSNADVISFARRIGAFTTYVHPVFTPNPFPVTGAPDAIPLELVPDALAGNLDGLEIACLWSDELGTSELWYRLLNLGLPIMPTAGTDVLMNSQHMMPIGATRVYVHLPSGFSFAGFFSALRQGRSFVTTGPMIEFQMDRSEPGDVIAPAAAARRWVIDLWSPTPVNTVEIVVNGTVAWRHIGPRKSSHIRYRGMLELPANGWFAARAYGGKPSWPVTDTYPFVHTAPIWIRSVGSRDPGAADRARGDLLQWLRVAKRKIQMAYGPEPNRLSARLEQAETRLRDEFR